MTSLFTRQLIPYFSLFPLESMSWPIRPSLQARDLKKWLLLPKSYLSQGETLELITLLMNDSPNKKIRLLALDYLEDLTGKSAEASFLVALAHFEEAIELSDYKKSQAHLRLASYFFQKADKGSHLALSARLHLVLTLVARDQLLLAVKLLHTLTKTRFPEGQEVIFCVWQILEKIYQAIGRPHWSEHYRLKRLKRRAPLGPSQMMTSPLS